nr:hypothetical protein [Tanacetum cinerariifolium]
ATIRYVVPTGRVVIPTGSATSASKMLSYGDSLTYSSSNTYYVPSNSNIGSHRSGNVIKDVLQSFVADTQPEQQLEFGMIDGCDFEDAIKEGAAKIYNLITGAYTEEASTADDVGQFALVGVTSEENELGWDDSTVSVFTTNSKDVEGRPLFNSDKSSKVKTNDFVSSNSSVKSLEPKPNDSTSCASNSSVFTSENEGLLVIRMVILIKKGRTGKVNIPPARPQPVPTGKPKVFAPVPAVRQNRPFPVPTNRAYSPSENPFSEAEVEGIFDSGCSRSMTGRITGKGTIRTPTGSVPVPTGSILVSAGDTMVSTDDVPVHTIEPRSVAQALEDPSWVDAIQEEYNSSSFKMYGFLLICLKMDVKSAFLYRGIDEELMRKYISLTLRVLWILNIPRRRCTIDKTLFLKKNSRDIIL